MMVLANRQGKSFFAFLLLVLFSHAYAAVYVVDNDAGPPGFITSGSWNLSSFPGYNNGAYLTVHSSDPPSYALWIPDIETTETLRVFAVFRRGANRTQLAPFTIHHAGGTDIVPVNMYGTDEIIEVFLGEYLFNKGTEGYIRLDNTGAEGYYIADAVLFKSPGSDPPEIRNLGHFPLVPDDLTAATVKALALDDLDQISTVTLHYSSLPGGGSGTVPAFDDGLHGDEEPLDDIYGAPIPPQPLGDIVTYHFTAMDNLGNLGTSDPASYMVRDDTGTSPGIFILAGQSNASGRGELNANTEQSDFYVFMFANDYRWKQAYEPVDDPANQLDAVSNDSGVITLVRGHGFSLRAAKEIKSFSPRTIHLIPCPRGGTRISQWRKPVNPFDRAFLFGSCNYRRLIAAPQGVTALWWYQGESDAGSSTFIQDHTALISEFRQEMGSDLPVVYVQLARHTNLSSSANQHKTAEVQRQMETGSGSPASLARHYMVVTFDLPLGDSVHINQAAQKELGRRVGLATLQHVYGLTIEGTGPRLILNKPITHPLGDRSKILVRFDQSVNPSVNNYDNQFRVFVNAQEATIESVIRDPGDDRCVLISLNQSGVGEVDLSYGDFPAPSLNSSLIHVIKGANDLPAPRFGPLPVETTDDTRTEDWKLF